MLRRQVSVLLGFLLLGGGLAYGLAHLLNLRMEAGDVFPPYSTLRTDPLGTKVLLDSLNGLPGLNAWRNYRPLVRLKPDAPITLVYAGINYEVSWEEKELSHFENLVANGSRAIFAFAPERARTPQEEQTRRLFKEAQEKGVMEKDGKKAAEKKDNKDGKPESKAERRRRAMEKMLAKRGPSFEKVAQKWGFKFHVPQRLRDAPAPDFTVKAEGPAAAFEKSLPWHSELYFNEVKAPWQTLYTMHGKAVLIERPWEKGSIVLASDSYFLSNEGLFGKERSPKLLAHLLGSPRTIVFDEEHLGVTEEDNISMLARKYRLHGLIGGLALIAALFLWQNIVRFVPPQAEALEAEALVTGRGSSEGFLALLRRSVPAGQLLTTCLAEWRRTFAHDPRALERVNAAFPQLPPRKTAEIVAAYGVLAKAVISNQRPVISRAPEPSPAPATTV